MFDEVICHYPLPDGWVCGDTVFQTKDTPEQWLTRYILEGDGTLRHAETGELVPLHGTLTFYSGNVCMSGPEGFATSDDEPPWQAEYVALYDHGRLLKVEGARRPCEGLRAPQLRRDVLHGLWRSRPPEPAPRGNRPLRPCP
jgi:hypothetical protein